MATLLEANEVTKIYAKGQRPSLNKVSFNVAESEFIAIMGASGSGKTTLLNVLSTIDINDVSQLDNFIVSKKPDIILMDINLKNISSEDGLELAKQILSCYPEQRVVILSGYNLPVYRSEARKIGAKGFVNKNIEPEKLISILSKIMQGILYFDREIPFIEGLTDSEKQIIQLIAEGQKRKDIASTLYISGAREIISVNSTL